MRVTRAATPAEAAYALAAAIGAALHGSASPVIGLATGRTPIAAYRILAADPAARELARRCLFVMLDEYVGMPPGSPDRFASVLESQVLVPLGCASSQLLRIDVDSADHAAAAAAFDDALVRLGGVDLQILGIGTNGHIGFNEPGSAVDGRTRVVRLAESTRRDNLPTLRDVRAVPEFAITQGIATIRAARHIVLTATGVAKADIVRRVVEESPSIDVPATALRDHPDCEMILDPDAAASLAPTD